MALTFSVVYSQTSKFLPFVLAPPTSDFDEKSVRVTMQKFPLLTDADVGKVFKKVFPEMGFRNGEIIDYADVAPELGDEVLISFFRNCTLKEVNENFLTFEEFPTIAFRNDGYWC